MINKDIQLTITKLNAIIPLNNLVYSKIEMENSPQQAIKLIQESIAKHYDITKYAHNVNEVFGISSLITLATNFQMMVILIFYLIHTLKDHALYNLALTIDCSLWTVILFGHTYYLLKAWDAIQKEVSLNILQVSITITFIHIQLQRNKN